MPAIFTHIQFGKEVAALLPPPLRELTEKYPKPFYLGTQGPDILFYHKPMKKKEKNPARKLGWDMHAVSSAQFFQNAAKLLCEDENNRDEIGNFAPKTAEAAYILGFLCHFTLDSACHPAIDKASVNGLTHGKIESELDKYFFRKNSYPARGVNAADFFYPSEDAQQASANILGVTEENTALAMRSMHKINRLFSHKCGAVHGFCHAVLTLAGMNKTFGEMFLHKKDDERCKDLLPLLHKQFDEAKEIAANKIVEFFDGLTSAVGKDEFYRYNYSGDKE